MENDLVAAADVVHRFQVDVRIVAIQMGVGQAAGGAGGSASARLPEFNTKIDCAAQRDFRHCDRCGEQPRNRNCDQTLLHAISFFNWLNAGRTR